MKLGEYLDIKELHELILTRFISMRRHPSLPMAILNYTNACMFNDLRTDTIQKCRGLIIHLDANQEVNPECLIISRPFRKFFNLNNSNQEDYQESNLPLVEPTVTEKMDGWFGIMWKYGNECGVASRGSFTSPGAIYATNKIQKLVKYGATEEFPAGYTPIFEIIFKEGKIVVDYSFEGLVLLGCVNNETGEELPYDELQNVWAKIAGYAADNRPWIRLVKAHRMKLGDCYSHPEKNFEGFVLSYPRPGTYPIKVKVKLEEYKRLHKLITGVTPQQIWKALHDPMAQWFDSDIPESFRKWALRWRDELYASFHHQLEKVIYDTEHGELWSRYLVTPTKSMLQDDKDLRKSTFEDLQKYCPDKSHIIMNLLLENYYGVHQTIWELIRPVGRETEVFYREGADE